MKKQEKVKTAMLGNNRGPVTRVEYPANAKKHKRETQAAFLSRVGTYTVVSAA